MKLDTLIAVTLAAREALALPVDEPAPQTSEPVSDGQKKFQDFFTLPEDIQSKTCTDPVVKDATMDSKKRWEGLGTDKVLTLANSNYIAGKVTNSINNIPYTEYISHYFNGPEGWSCSSIANKPCTDITQCDDVNHPAGYFILNSFSSLHALAQTMYDEIDHARGDLMFSMGPFMKTFAPAKKPDLPLEIFKTILDTALFVTALGSAWGWNKFIKTNGNGGILSSDDRGFMKDVFNGAVAYSYNLAKDNKKSPANLAEQQADLEHAGNVYYKAMGEMTQIFNDAIFDGEGEHIYWLNQAVADGKMMPNNDVNLDTSAFKANLNGAVYSQLIPRAWKTNPEVKNYPIVLEGGEGCDDRKETGEWFPNETADKTKVCIDGQAYYLLHAVPRANCQPYEECEDAGEPWFTPLPGGEHDEINGEKWGPLKIEDIVRSVRDGFSKNGNKNGFKMSMDIPTDDLNAWFDSMSLSAAGMFPDVPFCSKDMFKNLVNRLSGDPSLDSDYWPCD